MVPILNLIGVKLGYVHVLGLPGGLVVRQLAPFDQVVDVVLPVHTGEENLKAIIHSLVEVLNKK